MKVTNQNDLPFSLQLADLTFEVIDAGARKDMELNPAMVDYYRTKGFDIKEGKADADAAADKTHTNSAPAKAPAKAPAEAPAILDLTAKK